jgi:hypothetical protein
MMPSMPAVRTLSLFLALCAVAGPTLLKSSPALAITGSSGSERGGRSEPEVISMNTLLSMSEAGLRYVLANPRGYKLDTPRFSIRDLGALASALIYAPNRSRDLIAKLNRAGNDKARSFILETMLFPNYGRSSRLSGIVSEKREALRAKGYLVNFRSTRSFGQKSSDPEVDDLYRLYDKLTAQLAYNTLLRVLAAKYAFSK